MSHCGQRDAIVPRHAMKQNENWEMFAVTLRFLAVAETTFHIVTRISNENKSEIDCVRWSKMHGFRRASAARESRMGKCERGHWRWLHHRQLEAETLCTAFGDRR